MYKIFLLAQARKDLDELHGSVYARVKNKIISLSKNPRPFGSLKLTQEDGYRLRIGEFRVIYRIDDKAKEVFIYRIKYRKDAYR